MWFKTHRIKTNSDLLHNLHLITEEIKKMANSYHEALFPEKHLLTDNVKQSLDAKTELLTEHDSDVAAEIDSHEEAIRGFILLRLVDTLEPLSMLNLISKEIYVGVLGDQKLNEKFEAFKSIYLEKLKKEPPTK